MTKYIRTSCVHKDIDVVRFILYEQKNVVYSDRYPRLIHSELIGRKHYKNSFAGYQYAVV